VRRALLVAALAGAVAGCPGRGDNRRAAPAPQAAVPPIAFEDVTGPAGIRFRHHTGADGRYRMPESVGPGGAFLDYDNDGRLDVLLVNSADWPDRRGGRRPATPALYRNQGDGTFREVTREAGLAVSLYGQGCAVADYDGDGWDDLLITCVGPNRLFRNRNGRFTDVTAAAGLAGGPRWAWHTSAAWFDYDGDGRLDLFICRYVRWSPETDVPCRDGNGRRTYCGPTQYTGDASALFRNLGGGRFRDVSRETGIAGALGKGLGVVPLDENEDGRPDLFVSNDLVRNHLWRNEGGRFREVADEAGVAVADNGRARAGMGVDAADTRNDGGLAYCIGNFAGEGLALFDRGPGAYTDRGGAVGLLNPSLRRLTFGLAFLDANLDGWEDLVTANGHVDPHARDLDGSPHHAQRLQLFANREGRFRDVTDAAGAPLQVAEVGRGLARGDFDDDGRPDLLVTPNDGPARLLRNVSPAGGGWVGFRLHGPPGNRHGYGAEVRLTAGGRAQRRWVRSGGSYLSHHDPRALFGLGGAVPERVEVHWPGGAVTTLERPEPGRYHDVRPAP